MSETFPREAYPTGERVFIEGAGGDCAYIVHSGKVSITKTSAGKDVVLATVGPGSIIGELALIDDAPRMATATALEATVLLKVDRAQLQRRIKIADPLIRKLLMILVENYRSLTERHIAANS